MRSSGHRARSESRRESAEVSKCFCLPRFKSLTPREREVMGHVGNAWNSRSPANRTPANASKLAKNGVTSAKMQAGRMAER